MTPLFCTFCGAEGHRASQCKLRRPLREADIERHLVKRVKALGGEVRKVAWVGRKSAPDRVVLMFYRRITPDGFVEEGNAMWVELKRPDTIATFPANAHERAQHREHERMRRMGQRVEVIGTIEQVEELLS